MKVHIDKDICAGFGVCLGLSEEVFELHDDGYAIVRVREVPPELEDVVRKAADQCPSRAIFIIEDEPR